jgi:large subunit ribosomal protein L6
MSRIGRLPIQVPPSVDVSIVGRNITVKGPKGELSRALHPDMTVSMEGSTITVERPSEAKHHKQLHGLTRTLVANMVIGVTDGYKKHLEMSLGYSHLVEMEPPSGISFELETPLKVAVVGIDKELVGQIAAQVRAKRKPEPYKGKGIHYVGEVIRRKAGKAGKIGGKK